jgi:tetratricopeptide (TPR) repeat protein
VYLQAGQLDRAEAHFAAVAADDVGGGALESTKALNAAFLASARGEWDAACRDLARAFRAGRYELCCEYLWYPSFGAGSDDRLSQAVNNLAVALLGQGKLKEGIEVLEAALETSPSTLAMAEAFPVQPLYVFMMWS